MAHSTLETVSSIDLSRNGVKQNIYSTQIYGCFFSIYAEFQSTSNETYQINEIKLGLVMYKGLINIGITKAEITITENGNAELKIEVQALPSFSHYALKIVDFPEGPIIVNKSDAVLDILRYVKPIKDRDPLRDPFANQLLENVFDEEFYYREGPHEPDSREIVPKKWGEEIDKFFPPSPRCPRAQHEIK